MYGDTPIAKVATLEEGITTAAPDMVDDDELEAVVVIVLPLLFCSCVEGAEVDLFDIDLVLLGLILVDDDDDDDDDDEVVAVLAVVAVASAIEAPGVRPSAAFDDDDVVFVVPICADAASSR